MSVLDEAEHLQNLARTDPDQAFEAVDQYRELLTYSTSNSITDLKLNMRVVSGIRTLSKEDPEAISELTEPLVAVLQQELERTSTDSDRIVGIEDDSNQIVTAASRSLIQISKADPESLQPHTSRLVQCCKGAVDGNKGTLLHLYLIIGNAQTDAVSQIADEVVTCVQADDPEIQGLAADRIASIADAGYPEAVRSSLDTLVGLLTHEDEFVRKSAVVAIGRIAENGEPIHDKTVITDVASLLDDEAGVVRARALQALGFLAQSDTTVRHVPVEDITEFLSASRADVRAQAASALWRVAETGEIDRVLPTMDQIGRCLTDPDENVRLRAVSVLIPIAQNGRPDAVVSHIGSLQQLFTDDSASIRHRVTSLISALAERGEFEAISSSVDLVIDALHDEPEVQVVAAGTLAVFAEQGRSDIILHSTDLLRELLSAEEPLVRSQAVAALGKIAKDGNAEAVVSLLDAISDLLYDEFVASRENATMTIGWIAAAGNTQDVHQTIERIVTLLLEDDLPVQAQAAEALGWMVADGGFDRVAEEISSSAQLDGLTKGEKMAAVDRTIDGIIDEATFDIHPIISELKRSVTAAGPDDSK